MSDSASHRSLFPDQVLTLKRPMRLFKGMLGLEPGTPGVVSVANVLAAALGKDFERDTKEKLGTQAKNFENARRGRNTPTSTTEKNIRAELGWISGLIPRLLLDDPSGPLMPEVEALWKGFEPMFVSPWLSRVVDHGLTCTHCQATLLLGAEDWWAQTRVHVEPGCFRLVDRMLLIPVNIADSKRFFSELLDPSKSPMGHWLHGLATQLDLDTLSDLERDMARRAVLTASGGVISANLIKKWSSQQHLLPAKTAMAMTAATPELLVSRLRYFAARSFALICDIIASATDAPVSRAVVQETVRQRFEYLAAQHEDMKPTQEKLRRLREQQREKRQ